MSERLTAIERRAIIGQQALGRELARQYAEHRDAHQTDFLVMLHEIALAHGLSENAFDGEYGINTETWEIVPAAPPEEITVVPERLAEVIDAS